MKQRSLSMTGYFDKGKKTRREVFLAEMGQVVPWARLVRLGQYLPSTTPLVGNVGEVRP